MTPQLHQLLATALDYMEQERDVLFCSNEIDGVIADVLGAGAMVQANRNVQTSGAMIRAIFEMLFMAPCTAPCSSAGTACEMMDCMAGEPIPARDPATMMP